MPHTVDLCTLSKVEKAAISIVLNSCVSETGCLIIALNIRMSETDCLIIL